MSKTIKELADELGVPKNKVNYQLSKIDAQSVSKFVKIKHGVKHLETPIQKMIADNMRLKLSDQKSFKNDEFKQVINHLEEQNKAKDQQIKELHRLLDQSQQLQLMTEKKLQALKEPQYAPESDAESRNDVESEASIPSVESAKKPTSFWQRLFSTRKQ
ncbi:hypothetical protein [Lacticaseibacillus paracasei]|jgi:transcriptional antiterminator|nr:hypothetical protein [Lacticaseibacillus paracasei]MBM6411317.1 replication protein B [Lacticaseibacillus paracasei]MDM7527944.1 replication protein B [Lacticaseibacillus paracasei]MDO5967856.1 replication protein B [Lacticaseibacillus paracasei]RND42995.1 hypothetical protein FAM18108_03038 [Lacticaseibacillus paracasei]RNE33836.1 hypothetical protein FAM6410_02483 [Lacticaseibacillus paracasei]